jgi:3-dehydrosphinganine reductase
VKTGTSGKIEHHTYAKENLMAYTTFTGKNCLITGGSSGIGLALAREFAALGANTWILARNRARLDSALETLLPLRAGQSHQIESIACDVTDEFSVNEIAAKLAAHGHTPDVLVNSAGIVHPGYVQDLPLDIFRQMMETNYFGTVFVSKAFLPHMIERRSGHVVNLSSIAGYIGAFGYTAYGGSKFAVTGFSEALRAEMKPHNIRISVVFPPDTDTPQLEYENRFKPLETRALGESAGKMTAEAVARAILKGMNANQFRIFPSGESAFYYRVSSIFNEALNAYADWIVNNARKKHDKR